MELRCGLSLDASMAEIDGGLNMSARWSRRTVLRGSILGIAGVSSALTPARASFGLNIPDGPMVLQRKLIRELRDGAHISVTRNWSVHFIRSQHYIEVSGDQISASVDAPSRLKPFVELEENRREEAFFPLMLNDGGQIAGGGRDDDRTAVSKAAAMAERMFKESSLTNDKKALASLHLQQMQRASQSVFKNLPRDLLFPSQPAVHKIQPVNLPNGISGEFELTYHASARPMQGWLDHAERKIITRIGSHERRSIEHWTLAPSSV